MMNQGKQLWDIEKVKLSWDKPYREIPLSDQPQRILPDDYQCYQLKKEPNLLLVKDNFLNQERLSSIQELSKKYLLGNGWSIRLQKEKSAQLFKKFSKRKQPLKISQEIANTLEDDMLAIGNQFWSEFSELLFTEPDKIQFLHTWINTGPLSDWQTGKYHFTHYDCDEYLEFSKGLYRFPPYAVVFYLSIPEDSVGGVTWFPEIKQGVIPKTNRLAIFDARLAHCVLPVFASTLEPRLVMVMNLWDYATRDEQYEMTNGILNFTEDRRGELKWLA